MMKALAVYLILSVFSMNQQVELARMNETKRSMRALMDALEQYHRRHSQYPTTKQGLGALLQAPMVPPIPKNYPEEGYLSKMPKDGWGRNFVYYDGVEQYKIISYGADGKPGGDKLDADILSDDLKKEEN